VPAQERKAIEDMDHEELMAALSELREEAVKADMRVHAAVHRLAQRPPKLRFRPTSKCTRTTWWSMSGGGRSC
jgi:ribosomal protein L29